MELIKKKQRRLNYDMTQKFKNTTGLNIADFMHGINPRETYRNSSDCLINIFEKEAITKSRIKKIFNKYRERILLEFLNDLYIRNKCILVRKSMSLMEEHINVPDIEELDDIINKYFNEDSLLENEKFILMGLLQKTAELVDIYGYSNLKNYENYIKTEIDIGIFENIVVNGKKYTNKARENLVKLSDIWDKDIINKYQNLGLLKHRFSQIPGCEKKVQVITAIKEMHIDDMLYLAEDIKKEILNLYLSYEEMNRKNIIQNVYLPRNKKDVIIDSPSNLKKTALLHFFGVYTKIFSFEEYLFKLEKDYGRELTIEERECAKHVYEVKSNNFIPNLSLNINAIGQSDTGELYSVNTSNQLSCMLISFDKILKMQGIRGNLALGFAKDKLKEELIATISNKNMHSNKNIEFIETKNDFKEFSCSFNELLYMPADEENTELVMFRNTDLATLKPSYVLYISYRDIKSEEEQENINFYKEKMQEAGLDIPFVIFDTVSINKKIEEEKEER